MTALASAVTMVDVKVAVLMIMRRPPAGRESAALQGIGTLAAAELHGDAM